MASVQENNKNASTENGTPGKRILLVEGQDDEHVVRNICGRLKLGSIDRFATGKVRASSPENPNASPAQGKEALLQALPTELKRSDIHSLAIILDADGDNNDIEAQPGGQAPGNGTTRTWQAIARILKEAGYPDVPENPDRDGTIIPAPSESHPDHTRANPDTLLRPRVGIWIMPDNRLDGTLETFLTFLVPEDDRLLPHAARILDELPNVEPSPEKRFKPVHRQKALMHTWLAWQQEPGKPYGQAITARYLDTSLPEAKTFAEWLRKTFCWL